MLSSSDLERLIAVKRRDLEKEKTILGLSTCGSHANLKDDKENTEPSRNPSKQVCFKEQNNLIEYNDSSEDKEESPCEETNTELDIPPDLERYIRRYLGLPVMLKAGEYSPNNPLVRGERPSGDVLLGLGEYERRRNTLRKIRQQQYREYLDQQAKKKQEAKEQAERERREREQKEREREEKEREILLERDRYSPERRTSVLVQNVQPSASSVSSVSKVDTGVQVDGFSSPLSVAVQTDDDELFRWGVSGSTGRTRAERELSPRGAQPATTRAYDYDEPQCLVKKCDNVKSSPELRRSSVPSLFDAEAIRLRNLQAEKEAAERRQYYQQELKNQILEQQRIREERKNREKMLEQAEMRRLEEQLRMLRVAQDREMNKQLDITAAMTQSTSDFNSKRTELQKEIDAEKHKYLRTSSQPIHQLYKRPTLTSKSDTNPSKLPFYYPSVYDKTNAYIEKKPYSMNIPDNSIFSSNYDVESYLRKNLNFNKDKTRDRNFDEGKEAKYDNEIEHNSKLEDRRLPRLDRNDKLPRFDDKHKYEMHNPKNSELHNFNKDVEILHKYDREKERTNRFERLNSIKSDSEDVQVRSNNNQKLTQENRKSLQENELHNFGEDTSPESEMHKYVVEKAIVHRPGDRPIANKPSVNLDTDSLPIPVLRHSPTRVENVESRSNMSEAMKKVEDKWKVPAVQKNILKALPTEDGGNVSILTQLGSIRRQLQLEQLKLDKMMSKDDA